MAFILIREASARSSRKSTLGETPLEPRSRPLISGPATAPPSCSLASAAATESAGDEPALFMREIHYCYLIAGKDLRLELLNPQRNATRAQRLHLYQIMEALYKFPVLLFTIDF